MGILFVDIAVDAVDVLIVVDVVVAELVTRVAELPVALEVVVVVVVPRWL